MSGVNTRPCKYYVSFFLKHIRASLSICATFKLPCQASILAKRKLMKSNMMFDSRLMQVYMSMTTFVTYVNYETMRFPRVPFQTPRV